MSSTSSRFTVMAKPAGPACNLNCAYCFYQDKRHLYPEVSSFRMPPEVLESFIRQYIESQQTPEVQFAWQGGEPTILGVDFFQQVVELQKKYANGRTIANVIVTNGTFLNDEWCDFLTAHRFLVGISIDGPRGLHDRYRLDKQRRPTFDRVLRGIGFLKKHGTAFNTLTVVNRENARRPIEVYRFLKEVGSGFLQFIPLVGRVPVGTIPGAKVERRPSGSTGRAEPPSDVTQWSVQPQAFGEFYVQIFDEWIRKDVGRVFVQLFDVTLANWMGLGSPVCCFAEQCGQTLIVEHDGSVFSCDHYVDPGHRLGNILHEDLSRLAALPAQIEFGRAKRDTLPAFCRACDVLFACNGECPKNRFARTPDGEEGLNYLCAGYKRFFRHVAPKMEAMARLVDSGFLAEQIMADAAAGDRLGGRGSAGRNNLCPCGSGVKYKKCCGRLKP
jgi:uncharacterized protein